MRKIIFAIVAGTLVSSGRAIAQDGVQLTPGTKVRVTVHTLGLNKQVGTVYELRGDTLVIQTKAGAGADMLRVSIPATNRLDVKAGTRRHWAAGAGIGFLAGGVTVLAWKNDPTEDWWTSDANKALAGGGVGLLVGAALGALITSDRWSEVPLDQIRPRLVAQLDGRVGVGVVMRF
ncbi:MAG: hypothetical protein E4G90_07445 [Gemmatimonadales bacterium]|nr:MAG: hypothetical protein E4G90_07445 [Gemmatimonadales bacterium]